MVLTLHHGEDELSLLDRGRLVFHSVERPGGRVSEVQGAETKAETDQNARFGGIGAWGAGLCMLIVYSVSLAVAAGHKAAVEGDARRTEKQDV